MLTPKKPDSGLNVEHLALKELDRLAEIEIEDYQFTRDPDETIDE